MIWQLYAKGDKYTRLSAVFINLTLGPFKLFCPFGCQAKYKTTLLQLYNVSGTLVIWYVHAMPNVRALRIDS